MQAAAVMQGNGTFSLTSGIVLGAGAFALDSVLGLEPWLLAVLGVGLIGYGITLFGMARRADAVAGLRYATAMDLLWVVGAAAIPVGFPNALNSAARIGLFAVTVVVAGFAAAQWRLLRQSR